MRKNGFATHRNAPTRLPQIGEPVQRKRYTFRVVANDSKQTNFPARWLYASPTCLRNRQERNISLHFSKCLIRSSRVHYNVKMRACQGISSRILNARQKNPEKHHHVHDLMDLVYWLGVGLSFDSRRKKYKGERDIQWERRTTKCNEANCFEFSVFDG